MRQDGSSHTVITTKRVMIDQGEAEQPALKVPVETVNKHGSFGCSRSAATDYPCENRPELM